MDEIRQRSEQVIELLSLIKQVDFDLPTLIEAFPFPAWIDDIDTGRTLNQNRASFLVWGNVIGKSIDELDLDPAILEICKEEDQRVRSGEIVRAENIFGLTGREEMYLKNLLPIRDIVLGFCIPKDRCHNIRLTVTGDWTLQSIYASGIQKYSSKGKQMKRSIKAA